MQRRSFPGDALKSKGRSFCFLQMHFGACQLSVQRGSFLSHRPDARPTSSNSSTLYFTLYTLSTGFHKFLMTNMRLDYTCTSPLALTPKLTLTFYLPKVKNRPANKEPLYTTAQIKTT